MQSVMTTTSQGTREGIIIPKSTFVCVCAEEERGQRGPHQAPQRPLPGGGSHRRSAETGTPAQLPTSRQRPQPHQAPPSARGLLQEICQIAIAACVLLSVCGCVCDWFVCATGMCVQLACMCNWLVCVTGLYV